MTVKWKICENCGKKVNEVANKCPYCDSTSFVTDKIIVRTDNWITNVKHNLLYWKEDDGRYILSKTKVSSAIIFLFYPIVYFAVRYQISFYWKAWSSIIYGTRFSILVYMIGYLYHGLKKQNKTLNELLDIKFISILVLFISTLFNSISKFEIGIICSICIFILGNVIVNRFDFNFKDKLSYNLDFNGWNDSLISNLKYKLFYWKNDNGMVTFSKTKFFSILIIFIVTADLIPRSAGFFGGIFLGLILSFPVFFVGWIYHKSKESNDFINYDNTNNGLIQDIVHTFLFWGDDKTSNFRLSKTKIISLSIFLVLALISASNSNMSPVPCCIMGLIFSLPVFAVGYFIHQSQQEKPTLKDYSSSNKIEPKKESTIPKKESLPEKHINTPKKIPEKKVSINKTEPLEKSKIHPSLLKYKTQVDNLIIEFESKEDNVRKLIEKRFEPPQLTYTKFISSVDKCCELFNNQVDATMTMINLASEETESIDLQIEKNINVLKLLIGKLDKLSDALVVNIGKSKVREKELNNFMEDMEDLIGSVDSYE